MKKILLTLVCAISLLSCDGLTGSTSCCRVCRTGKACGNSCISRDRTCRQPRGCACNGDQMKVALTVSWDALELGDANIQRGCHPR